MITPIESLAVEKMSLSSGTELGHYQIHSKLGEGGMGEVYLALDTKLGRKVALKILPAELASNQDRMRRFTQEAKAAAALNHPNIAHIYEIGDHDGTSFIAMEYVDGYTLRQLIQGGGNTRVRSTVSASKLVFGSGSPVIVLRHLAHNA